VANWQGTRLPPVLNLRLADLPKDFAQLPTVSFVIPDQNNDMHDGDFERADRWLKARIEPYVEWAYRHNSLLILTWDEDDYREGNHIVTILVGPMVKTGTSAQRIDHYNVLRTLLDLYGLPRLARAAMRRRSGLSGSNAEKNCRYSTRRKPRRSTLGGRHAGAQHPGPPQFQARCHRQSHRPSTRGICRRRSAPGGATAHMMRYLAGVFGVPLGAIEVVFGERSVHKQIRIKSPKHLPAPIKGKPIRRRGA